jgi:ABC-type multidrug transport system fused ATPase/permease subunit
VTARQAIRASLGLLNQRDRRLLGVSIAIQMATSLLDLVGVLLLGLVAALAVTVVQSQPPPAAVTSVVDRLGLQDLSGQQLIVALAGTAAVVLLTKSVVSSYLTRRVFIFLANRQALVSARLASELLARPVTFLQKRSSQETAFALIQGTGAATIQILGQMSIVVTEGSLLLVLSSALLFLDPWVTIAAIAFFSLVAVILQRAMGGWAARLGREGAAADIASLNAVQEALNAYREVTVSDRRGLYIERIQGLRWLAARVAAEITFVAMLPKYVFEAALVIGAFALAGLLFATQDAVAAVGTLALFLAAGSRVMPSLLRLQGAALTLRSAAGTAQATFELASDLGTPLDTRAESTASDTARLLSAMNDGYPGFLAYVEVRDIAFAYPGRSVEAISGVSLSLAAGQSLAIVGSSGAGKSTLADLILGIIEPIRGTVDVGGSHPSKSCRNWPGAFGYVPQSVMLANATVRENVALGLPPEAIDDDRVWEALRRAHLADFLAAGRDGLDTYIGEGGTRLSGGQRQRLGIARALYSRPRILVLDEATSALDASTEAAIGETLAELEGYVTTITIAHRLSTVRHADLIVYLSEKDAPAVGSFEDIYDSVPDFARQADLLGLRRGDA